MNEVRILQQLSHSSVLRLLDLFRDDSRIYIVTEYYKGGELFALVDERGPMKEEQAKTIARQMVNAIKYLHDNNICHRDIKPENVLLKSKSSLDVALIDFGLSRECTGSLKTRIGTPYYVAPEIVLAEHSGPYNHMCDMWSLGVVVYFMLFGIPPFLADNDTLLFAKIVKCDYSFPQSPAISEDARDFISRLLVVAYEEGATQRVRMTAQQA